ncbi:hypothetical protein C8F04DRAFT_1247577 [Mycena alexandri]|uniref:DUF6729 domain-containing protein n=1 Tax=Mycena alexandri TaxID=1745969 RepID=A0AAD6TM77_9AGAR|nr:hypothetical protein C8F04DRAFT_1247577 [Mycena alexandri]
MDEYFDDEEMDPSFFEELDELESRGFPENHPPHHSLKISAEQQRNLKPVRDKFYGSVFELNSVAAPFFTRQSPLDYDSDDAHSDDEGTSPLSNKPEQSTSNKAWFEQPKYMPDWLYSYFRDTIQPLITRKSGRELAKPACFTESPRTMIFVVSRHRFDPPLMYRPRVFLWLPHFFVDVLLCPECGKKLEKNGIAPPRRVIDMDECFYIVTWQYYCREGCQTHRRGWNPKLINSLPPYVRLAFPAILSRCSGLSHNVLAQLRVGNQHKMGPTGVRSLLFEMHTLRFNRLQAQYLEAIFELERGRTTPNSGEVQSSLHGHMNEVARQYPSFGTFDDPEKYAGFVPSEHYLAEMMNKAIEKDEPEANQHTACIGVSDELALDDSHKIIKHIATYEGVPIFNALWTCMDARHEERSGPLAAVAKSLKLYGYDDPKVVFSDDPVKDKALIYGAFPSLAKKLTPIATAHGLKALEPPANFSPNFLATGQQTEQVCSALMAPLELDPTAHFCVSLDAEWNVSRKVGVSILQIAPHTLPLSAFIIPVHKFKTLPISLLRLLVSN